LEVGTLSIRRELGRERSRSGSTRADDYPDVDAAGVKEVWHEVCPVVTNTSTGWEDGALATVIGTLA
jgi:hypothetical protein